VSAAGHSNRGKLLGVGVGPGDPELMTFKAMRALGQADVIAHFAKAGQSGHARAIAAPHVRPGIVELPLHYPMTTELPKCSERYREALRDFYDAAAEKIAAHLQSGRVVAVIAQGDDVFTVLPATLPEGELARRLADADAAVVMKVGRHLPKLRRALNASGRLARAVYVERGTMADAKTMALVDKGDDDAPYFAVVLVPGWEQRP
jgi:precorrin-2/cobalt-factor-2 C20-methyltransferase